MVTGVNRQKNKGQALEDYGGYEMKLVVVVSFALLLACSVVAGEPIGGEYRGKLGAAIRQHHPGAKVEGEGNRLVYRLRTHTFKIHTIHKNGRISQKPHDEEGPNVDGILVEVTIHDGNYLGQAEIPQDLHRPYWRTFINAYPVSGGQYLWVSISYGTRTDKKLVDSIKTCFGPVISRGPHSKNKTLERGQRTKLKDIMPNPGQRIFLNQ